MTHKNDDFVREVVVTAESIKPLLAGKPPPVQGAVLAELTALWITHHFVQGDEDEQRELWEYLFQMHMNKVRELMEVQRQSA